MTIKLTNFPIYKLMILISVITGIIYIFLSLKNKKISNKKILLFYVLFFILAIFIGKLYTFIILKGKISFFKCGLTAYGGLIGVVLAALIYEKIDPHKGIIIKYTAISLPLIYSFTKIGCFFTGCCYGVPYNGPFHVIYPQVLNKPLFPIQLLEVITFFIIFIF